MKKNLFVLALAMIVANSVQADPFIDMINKNPISIAAASWFAPIAGITLACKLAALQEQAGKAIVNRIPYLKNQICLKKATSVAAHATLGFASQVATGFALLTLGDLAFSNKEYLHTNYPVMSVGAALTALSFWVSLPIASTYKCVNHALSNSDDNAQPANA